MCENDGLRGIWVCALLLPCYAQQSAPRHESVTVIGSFEPVPLEEADRAVDSLPVPDLLPLTRSWVDFVRADPSLDLRQRAPDGIQGDLSIRGATFGQTLVLLDGLRLNDAQSGHHNLDVPVPLEAIERIEVLRGAGSALYGSDAVGGVVNFITRRPEVSEIRLRAAGGSFGTQEQRLSWSLVHGGLSQEFSASRDFSSGFRADRDYRNLSLSSSTHWRSTGLLLAHADRPFGADGFYGNYPSWERTRTWFGALKQALGRKTEASLAFRRHTDLFVLDRSRPEAFTNRHAVEGWQAALRRREDLGRNARLHYGAEGVRESIRSTNLGDHARSRGAAYAALDVRALGRFSFSAGAREEIYRRVGGQFSPNVSGGLWLTQHLKLRAAAGRAFRLPSFTDLYYHDPASRGSPDLRPETAWSFETGLDWNAGARLRVGVTVFQRRDRDGIDYVRASAADIWRAANIQRLRLTGVEASVRARLGRGQVLDAAYTDMHGAQAALGALQSRYLFNFPSQAGVAGWQGALPGGIVARTRLGATRRIGRDPYAVWDAAVSLARGRIHPFAQFTNLTGTTYQEIAGVPMPGRAVLAGLELLLAAPPH